jgi:CubicO group peptidase (beta-lactamase class C family)
MKTSVDFFAEKILDGEAWACSWEQDLSHPERLEGLVSNTRTYEKRVFDLASLTKVIVTSSLLVQVCEHEGRGGLVSWSENTLLSDAIVELKGTALEKLTLRECWEHRSGLSAYLEFSSDRSHFVGLADRALVHARVIQQAINDSRRLNYSRAQVATLYSDLGYSLLGVFLERKSAKTLDVLWESWKAQHLSRNTSTVASLSYQAEGSRRSEALQTETRHVAGLVNDDNTFAMGGIASHAGLFGSAFDVAIWIHAILAWARVSPYARDWLETPCPKGQRFVLGWDTPSGEPESQAGGLAAPPRVRGHLGYTGTALWMDPEMLRFGVLLTNRVHPKHTTESQKSVQKLRWWCFEALWRGTLEAGWKTGDKIGAGLIS